MSFNAIRYAVTETFLSLKRNGWMGLASVATVAISLIILGFAVTLVYNTTKITGNIESNIEISAFVNTAATAAQVQTLQNEIQQLPDVKSVSLISKEIALQQYQASLNNQVLSDLGGSNPLPDKFVVKAQLPEQVAGLAGKIGSLRGIDKVNYGQGVVDQLLSFTHWARWVGISIIALLSIASIVLISITIRLTVYARRREIQIMKFVGATDWFIRWPFLMEGLILGIGGAVLGGIVVIYGYENLVSYIQANLSFVPVVKDQGFMVILAAVLLGSGALIGAVGSMFSLHKFLKV
ncbi:MAG: permease-like cell division protein FtsX [Peptococcaceae bacterium]|nr:permease-like cell division protein FtsX [Peptococcaceae bacterium]